MSAGPTGFIPVLNAGLNWTQVKQEERDAFSGTGEKVKLLAGLRLYKFTQYDIESPSGVTPWWGPQTAYQWDAGLKARLEFAKRMGLNPSDLTRVVSAVRTNWNELTCILTAFLVKDVYGFWGRVGGQPRFGEQTIEHMRAFDKVLEELSGRQPQRISLPGGAGQFFIPNMKRNEHIRRGYRLPVADVIAGKADIY